MASTSRTFLGFAWCCLTFVVSGCSQPDADTGDEGGPADTSGDASGSSGGGPTSTGDSGGAVACVEPGTVDLEIEMLPAPIVPGSPIKLLDTDCLVEGVSDSPPEVQLSCALEETPIQWSLSASGLSASLSAALSVGENVHLVYYTNFPSTIQPRTPQAAVISVVGELSPRLVLNFAPMIILEDVESSLTVSKVPETDCAEDDGSCGLGVMRRSAIEVALDGVGTAIVFDRNAGMLGDFAIEVGEAIHDEGACDGVNAEMYEFIVLRQ